MSRRDGGGGRWAWPRLHGPAPPPHRRGVEEAGALAHVLSRAGAEERDLGSLRVERRLLLLAGQVGAHVEACGKVPLDEVAGRAGGPRPDPSHRPRRRRRSGRSARSPAPRAMEVRAAWSSGDASARRRRFPRIRACTIPAAVASTRSPASATAVSIVALWAGGGQDRPALADGDGQRSGADDRVAAADGPEEGDLGELFQHLAGGLRDHGQADEVAVQAAAERTSSATVGARCRRRRLLGTSSPRPGGPERPPCSSSTN